MSALDEVLPALRCGNCGATLRRTDATVRCAQGHSFDVARDGHLSLLPGHHELSGDTAAMVDDRTRVLESGAFDPLTVELVDAAAAVAGSAPSLVVDVAGGTGHHLAAILETRPGWRGVVLDGSTPAIHRAGRAHPALAAIGCDVTKGLPVGDRVAGLVVSSFGPRPSAEFARILHPDGLLVVVSPGAGHLGELASIADVTIDPEKERRLEERLAGFAPVAVSELRATIAAERPLQLALVGMGPSAFHSSAAERAERAAMLPETLAVSLAFRVARYRPSPAR